MTDAIGILVRTREDRPRHPPRLAAPGNAIHTIGAWPSHRILGTQLGPNRNGRGW